MNTKIFLLEDHPLFRKGVLSLIGESEQFEVVGEASTLNDARLWCSENSADIFLLDISVKGGNCFDLIPFLKTRYPVCKIVLLSMHTDKNYLSKALHLGVHGYLVKDLAGEKLLEVLDTVLRGQTCFLSSEDDGSTRVLGLESSLSAREKDVVRLVKEGKTLTEIGEILGISVKTVFTYRSRVMQKLGVQTLEQVV